MDDNLQQAATTPPTAPDASGMSSTQQPNTQQSGQAPASEPGASQPASTPDSGAAGQIGLSQEQFQELLSRVNPPQPAGQPQKQYSMEDFNRAFNVMQVDDTLLQAFGATEENAPMLRRAIEQMRDGFVRQSMTMAEYVIQQRLAEIAERYAPVEEVATEYRTEKLKAEFYGKYPDLKGLDELAIMVRDQFVREGKKFPTKDKALQAVAEAVRAKVKQLAGVAGVAGNGAGASQQQQQKSTTGMSTVSAGGQGGVGSTSGGKKPAWLEALS